MTAALLASLQRININLEKVMATLADISLAVQAQRSVEQGVVALMHQLSGQLQAALDAADPAAVQAVLDLLNDNTKELSDAVLANTPAAIGSATLSTPVPVKPTDPLPTSPPEGEALPPTQSEADTITNRPVPE